MDMYTGKQLGEAIRIAIDRKLAQGVRKKDIAAHFQIKEPSIADWIKKGSIDKEKLPRLWRYFADVAGLEHWGFTATDFECFGLSRQPRAADGGAAPYVKLRDKRIEALLAAADHLNDAGIDHLIGYAQWIANEYPRAKANAVN